MRIGYRAVQYGVSCSGFDLWEEGKTARKQLMEKLGASHAKPFYVDTKDGKIKKLGWIIHGTWWVIYELHEANLD